ncbi:conserved hypothetical protein [Candidatus Terasakiella magnetica]|nr:conserved hypothetical protein [Candidatus Terasakiella magnetica]
MARLIHLSEYRSASPSVRFERSELNQLLTLYAERVAGGDWRDYAINLEADGVVFSVYRHTLDRPLLTIAKWARGPRRGNWVISAAGRELVQTPNLPEALRALARHLHPVPS